MASAHVVVLDSSARRATIKVTAATYLSDVLEEACKKLGCNPSEYGLKNNNKQVDLTRTFRLSGLSTGAKLELVQISRSPSVVTVALQLPESEESSLPNRRLIDKFPSTTTLWLVLRKFESGVAAGGHRFNFTARGAPRTQNGDAGAGRLFYETPVLETMGREMASFTDLQKTLAQLGFNNGNALFRLQFRSTSSPLEESMTEISQYFRSVEQESTDAEGAHGGAIGQQTSVPESKEPSLSEQVVSPNSPAPEPVQPSDITPAFDRPTKTSEPAVQDSTMTGPDQRPISVFAPPLNNIPQAANHTFDETDYLPTISHAQLHQARLSNSTKNKRLLSDAELTAQEEETRQRVSSNAVSAEIKIRYPDQTSIVTTFNGQDTVLALLSFVQGTLREELASEPFSLQLPGPSLRGKNVISSTADQSYGQKKLIADLGISGRVLINFVWNAPNSDRIRSNTDSGVLKHAFKAKAQEITVPDIDRSQPRDDEKPAQVRATENTNTGKTAEDSRLRKGGIPKWLKLPGKK